MESVSIEEIQETIKHLCEFKNRIAGSDIEKDAASYLESRLRKIGFTEIEKHDFDVYSWRPQTCTVRIIKPVQKELKAALFPYSPSADIQSELIIHLQGENNSKNKHSKKIGLSYWGNLLYLGPSRAYTQAVNQGMSAVLIASPAEGDLLKVVVIEAGGNLKIPVISISHEDGVYLSELLEEGSVQVEIDSKVEIVDDAKSTNLEVVLAGSGEDELEVFMGAHYDAWFTGAADNAAPTAIVIEMARLVREYVEKGGKLKRNVRFVLFGSEESGATSYYYWLRGSKAYVDSHTAELKDAALMLSLDSIGFPKPANNYVATSLDLYDFVRKMKVDYSNPPKIIFYGPAAYGSDHWFFETSGVPTIYGVSFPSRFYHTQKDIPSALDYNSVGFHAEFMKTVLHHFLTTLSLPYDIFEPLSRFKEVLEEHAKSTDNPFDIDSSVTVIKEIQGLKKTFTKSVQDIRSKGSIELVKDTNRFLLDTVQQYNRTIGWLWRKAAPRDVDYLARLEYIQEYLALNAAITTLRQMPIANLDKTTAQRFKTQEDNPFTWVNVHDPLTALETERSRLFKIVEEELKNIMELLSRVETGIRKIISKAKEI